MFKILILLILSIELNLSCMSKYQKETEEMWLYANSLDATIAAPNSHIILMENDKVRVLKLIIKPGEKEPMHTDSRKSIMIVDQPARIRYYDDINEIVFESEKESFKYDARQPEWMEVEDLHAVENIDTVEYVATRIELKNDIK